MHACQIKNLPYIPDVVCRARLPQIHISNERHEQMTEQELIYNNAIKNSKQTKTKTLLSVQVESKININTQTLTYISKEPYEYFKPKINVEMDNPEKPDTVTEIHIKGFKIENQLLDSLCICIPHVERLHTIKYLNSFRIKFSN